MILYIPLTVILVVVSQTIGYPSDTTWAMTTRSSDKCFAIPENFTLCHGIAYRNTMMPNLLGHESLNEAIDQSVSWVHLQRIHCHPHSQLFLCSLFAPICIDNHNDDPNKKMKIYPCRSLCESVKAGCAARMEVYGFKWPPMLNCDTFPTEQMCVDIPPITETTDNVCPVCKPENRTNIEALRDQKMDTFCRSTHMFRIRVRSVTPTSLVVKNGRNIYPRDNIPRGAIRRMKMNFKENKEECDCPLLETRKSKQKYLVLAQHNHSTGEYTALQISPITNRNKRRINRQVRWFKSIDCETISRQIERSVQVQHNITHHRRLAQSQRQIVKKEQQGTVDRRRRQGPTRSVLPKRMAEFFGQWFD